MNFLVKLGAISGLISIVFIIIEKLHRYYKRPRLEILSLDEKRDLITTKFTNGEILQFFRIKIRNKKKEKAKYCIGVLKLINPDLPSGFDKIYRPKEYYLHWADISYSNKVCSPSGIEIFKIAPRFLDVIFTEEMGEPGCWIAVPFALKNYRNPHVRYNQFFIPQGEYRISIEVDCLNGVGDKKEYRIISPGSNKNLKVSEIRKSLTICCMPGIQARF